MKAIIRRITTIACTLLASTSASAVEKRRVVLTFDDACKSHATFVAPLLKKHGFDATFYITEGFAFLERKDIYMTWEEIKQLHDQGFEIGNHTRGHHDMRKLSEEKILAEIAHIDQRCEENGIPKPVTFAYPGYHYSDTVLQALKERRFMFARTGGGRASQPGEEDPLLLPDVLCATPETTFEDLKQAADQADGDHIPIFTFHGVPDAEHGWVSIKPALFEKFVQYLKDGGFQTIALRDYPAEAAELASRQKER